MAKFKVGDIVYFNGEDSTCRYRIIDRAIVSPEDTRYDLANMNSGRHVGGVLENYLISCKITEDVINHPSHYETGKFECIEVMEEALGSEAVKGFCLCNAFKYIYRHNRKNGDEDIEKAIWYLNHYIEIVNRAKEVDCEHSDVDMSKDDVALGLTNK